MTQTIEQLTSRVRELEEENARLKAESRDACLGLNDYYGRKLAAEQLNNKRLRDALNQWIGIAANCSIESGCCGCGESIENHSHPMMCGHSPVDMADSVVREAIDSTDKALSIPASSEALDKYAAEKVKEKTDALHYRMEHCYSIDHVKIQCELDKITKQRDLAIEALIGIENFAVQPWAGMATEALLSIKESEAK